uniref:L-gulonolactone oxidase n=1 Tax=Candidatus Kentrum sp. FM TaxID=2126340 RepID=A0A450WPA3_9GAMM|nr:MAG: L-gulonolactone oxidase [Candidatus Kentron sp. FM]VFJ69933.1 MAG: L-gulonolactone oxidase [Candidatus Kentron sp. FM]VFK18872.1 MAG: L-gulonolactone oxidase [Candidatus Kentron sp. FM]
MNKRTFYNWSEHFHCTPQWLHSPRSEADVIDIMTEISRRDSHVRVFGSGLSPNDIAMSDGELVLSEQFDRILEIDGTARTVTVQPGITLEKLSRELAGHGLALPVLGSISEQTVAGATATATHGTGATFGVLSSLIRAMRLVTPSGEVLTISEQENPALLQGARCHLGSLGMVTQITLQVCQAFDLAVTEQPSTLETVLTHLPERLHNDHYRFWYIPHTDHVWEWMAARTPPEERHQSQTPRQRLNDWFNEKFIDHYVYESLFYLVNRRPSLIPVISKTSVRARFDKPRHSKGPSRKQFTFDCLFKQHLNEWSIPIAHTGEALRGIRESMAQKGYYAHLPIEVRFVRGDDIWLSPCQGRDSCYIGVIAYIPHGRSSDHEDYLAGFERLMLTFGGRPHWGKFFELESEVLARQYPYWEDFQRVRRDLDPDYRLRNSFTDGIFRA